MGRGRPKGTSKWTPEEKAILNKCHEVYGYTRVLLKDTIEELELKLYKYINTQTLRVRAIKEKEERETELRKVRSIIKNAYRILLLRNQNEVDIKILIEKKPEIRIEISYIVRKKLGLPLNAYLDENYQLDVKNGIYTEDDEIRLGYLISLEKFINKEKAKKEDLTKREKPTVEDKPVKKYEKEMSADWEDIWDDGTTESIRTKIKKGKRKREDIYKEWVDILNSESKEK